MIILALSSAMSNANEHSGPEQCNEPYCMLCTVTHLRLETQIANLRQHIEHSLSFICLKLQSCLVVW